jgi:hypothetical protein
MPSIDKINTTNSVSRKNVKNLLGYAVRKRRGYYNELRHVDEYNGATIDSFKSVGFINTGHTLKHETYSVTDLGDEYYKDVFGRFNYMGKRFAGLWDKIKADLIDRLSE